MVGIGAFELGNIAATLLILRATELLEPGHGQDGAVQLALLLYAAYNLAATLASVPAGRLADRRGAVRVLARRRRLLPRSPTSASPRPAPSIALLAVCFVAAGIAIGCVETAEHAAVAAPRARADLRGSAFGLLAAVQSFGNLGGERDRRHRVDRGLARARGCVFAAAMMAVALACLALGTRAQVSPRRA